MRLAENLRGQGGKTIKSDGKRERGQNFEKPMKTETDFDFFERKNEKDYE